MKYEYIIIMDNRNKYTILSEIKNVEEFLRDVYGESGNRINIFELKKRINNCNCIVIGSYHISEILFNGVVVDEEI